VDIDVGWEVDGRSARQRCGGEEIVVEIGEATAVIAGDPYQSAAGDSIVMPADRPHAVQAVTPFRTVPTMDQSPA